MRVELFARIFFVLYCLEAGAFLAWAPWTIFWERALFGLPLTSAGLVLMEPLARGAVTGFGMIHLIWGVHDLEELLEAVLRRRRQRRWKRSRDTP